MTQTAQSYPTRITPSKGPGKRWLWAILVAAALLILLFFSAPNQQDGSTYSRSNKGYRGWYDFMVEQGYSINRWQKPYSELQGQNQTLIRITPSLEKAREQVPSWDNFDSWVSQGNTVILLTWDGPVTAASFNSDLVSEAGPVRIETARRQKIGSKQQSHLKDDYGSVVWSQSFGKGQMIFAAYPWIGANIYGDQPGNYLFLQQLVPESKTIWMDEWLHGYRDQQNQSAEDARNPENLWLFFAQTPVAAMAIQGVLLTLIWIWGHNHRFGLPLRLPQASKDNSQQYIQSLAGTLNHANQRELVLTQLSQYLRQSLAQRLGLTSRLESQLPTDNALAAQWSMISGRNDQELLELLQPSGQQSITDQTLLAWVNKADAILQDLP
ncbi:DUF4350 domain-containing protein [Acaryochloris sp. CCMEE 5410]|uniref:DUF4350 domain-containing protein n=1 Tax=Acaryochloris sp. CCMEE 5410 TaxID=310037 RepID=UPI0002484025|nr:DUF4350 domain-containing protein [Acaryochloris sp. CCMEE 5410]KAI9134121.1 DUF4350 domain-containing protein [Acaryochloris sp. CCMEE 5410]